MESLGGIAFLTIGAMTGIMFVLCITGKRHMRDLNPVDFAVSITAGTVAGAGIADSRIDLSRTIIALILLGLLRLLVSWLNIKFRCIQNRIHPKPLTLVENGQIIKNNLAKVRMTVEILLQLLRDKGIFDISEVEVAIFESQGTLSVLNKSEYLPVTPKQLKLPTEPNRILIPVILEGKLQIELLKRMGFSAYEIERFRSQYKDRIDDVFIAFIDRQHRIHIVYDDTREQEIFVQ